jgi:hypothetical protein
MKKYSKYLSAAFVLAISSATFVTAEESKSASDNWVPPVSRVTSVFDAKITSNDVATTAPLSGSNLNGLSASGFQPFGENRVAAAAGACPRIPANGVELYRMQQRNLQNVRDQHVRVIDSIEIGSTVIGVNPIKAIFEVIVRDTLGCHFIIQVEDQTLALRLADTLVQSTKNTLMTGSLIANNCSEQHNFCLAQLVTARYKVQ